jgi:hypothetical protein
MRVAKDSLRGPAFPREAGRLRFSSAAAAAADMFSDPLIDLAGHTL